MTREEIIAFLLQHALNGLCTLIGMAASSIVLWFKRKYDLSKIKADLESQGIDLSKLNGILKTK